MESTFDEVGLLIKKYSSDYINYYMQNCILGLSGSWARDLSHPKRESYHYTNTPTLMTPTFVT